VPTNEKGCLQKNFSGQESGLYIHIPWCRQICHYCDFAKTANHSQELRGKFLATLESHAASWLEWNTEQGGANFSSVFFGGGTPSVYLDEYYSLMSLIGTHAGSAAEMTLEANPDDITRESLKIWRRLGFNRISIGVQTFDELGLKAMHRVHSKNQALQAVELALNIFPSVNIDLIYGWQGQNNYSWISDLNTSLRLQVPHLSLYNLTYEPRTVIGRMAARGRLEQPDDSMLETYYKIACEQLAAAGFLHEEVSNWCKPNHSCAHNWLYWSDKQYIGVGPGAHGYIPSLGAFGLRYAYPRNERMFSEKILSKRQTTSTRMLPVQDVEVEDDRSMSSWIVETIGSSLRTNRGVDLELIARKSGRPFRLVQKIQEGVDSGALRIAGDGSRLFAAPSEWFREQYWALATISAFD